MIITFLENHLFKPLEKSQVCFPVYQLTMYNIDVIIYTVINNYQGRNCGFESEEAVENWDLTAQNNAFLFIDFYIIYIPCVIYHAVTIVNSDHAVEASTVN